MNQEEVERLLDCVRDTIEKKVNGRIEALHTKVDEHNSKHEEDMDIVKEHMKKVEPILEAYTGGKALGGLVKWAAGVITAVGIVWLAIKGELPTR